MKISLVLSVVFFLSAGCNNSTTTNDAKRDSTDTVGLTNPSAIDTTKHPSGMDNSSVTSTDTAAMNVQNTLKKADSISKQKNK